jgi:hypothetical protein
MGAASSERVHELGEMMSARVLVGLLMATALIGTGCSQAIQTRQTSTVEKDAALRITTPEPVGDDREVPEGASDAEIVFVNQFAQSKELLRALIDHANSGAMGQWEGRGDIRNFSIVDDPSGALRDQVVSSGAPSGLEGPHKELVSSLDMASRWIQSTNAAGSRRWREGMVEFTRAGELAASVESSLDRQFVSRSGWHQFVIGSERRDASWEPLPLDLQPPP